MHNTNKSNQADQPTHAMPPGWGALSEYWVDATQRTILFADLLRQRSEQYFTNKTQAVPHVLQFASEPILDARSFDQPVNYFLVRIKPPAGVVLDPRARPFVVIDPRAGHGPGIAGFKADSELGVALQTGHPCYFVGFTRDPVPGQTIEDVMHAEAKFLEKVIELHPEANGKPCIIGNCQAGWAVMMLAATRPDLCGPVIVPGSPLSYWAGIEGKSPMRYTGGLLGGSWLTAFSSDLGNGKFDGGHLVRNFENLDPANTLWTKQYEVWANIDRGAERYLAFEKWWGDHVTMNAEEIQWIVDNLFIGNRLATAELVTKAGQRIDLRNIRSPILCFCSHGDNITPPPQALGWITDLYAEDDDIRAAGQTIVYALHDSVGHLGIFVSANVAKKEYREFASNIDLVDVLPPGLYEAVMTPKTADAVNPGLVSGDWIVRFEPRRLDDIRAIVRPNQDNERRFAAVRRMSEINLGLYRSFVQRFVKAAANRHTAEWLEQLAPSELALKFFSGHNPLTHSIARLAESARARRHPASAVNPLVQAQAAVSDAIAAALDRWRDQRDTTLERLFLAAYDSPLLQAILGLRADGDSPRRRPGNEPERVVFIDKRISELIATLAEGDARVAAIRSIEYIAMGGRGVDERAFNRLAQMRSRYGELPIAEFKRIVRDQYFSLILDEEAAIEAIPSMLPANAASRTSLLEDIRQTVNADGDMDAERRVRLATIEALFALPRKGAVPKKQKIGRMAAAS